MNTGTDNIASVGESGVIDRLTRRIKKGRKPRSDGFGVPLLVDAGDDAAAWDSVADTYLFTTDAMVEGVHFTRQTLSWEDVGWKVMAVNVSDVAAMGGRPLFALMTLGLPGDFPVSDLDSLYEGAISMAKESNLHIIGGDTVKSPNVFVSVALIGGAYWAPMTREEAKPGDMVAVTGPLGSSAAGLALLQGEHEIESNDAYALIQAHRRPQPHLLQGRELVAEGVRCAMDVSDGLIADLSKLCLASKVSAQIESHRLPTIPALSHHFPETALQKALSGGEDYVLLFTAPTETMNRVTKLIPQAAVIGTITGNRPGRVTVMDENGNDVTPANSGWDHYR